MPSSEIELESLLSGVFELEEAGEFVVVDLLGAPWYDMRSIVRGPVQMLPSQLKLFH